MNVHENENEPIFERPEYIKIDSQWKNSTQKVAINSYIPNTRFRVDSCTRTDTAITFLTHHHTDHTRGINTATKKHVFASSITCGILKEIQQHGKLSDFFLVSNGVTFHPINPGELCVFTNVPVIPMDKEEHYTCDVVTRFVNEVYPDFKGKKQFFYTRDACREEESQYPLRVVVVQCLNAHHCPGSLMVLFEMYRGKEKLETKCFFRMFITGDFRFNVSMKKDIESLGLHTPEKQISLLHCDNTCYELKTYHAKTFTNTITNIKSQIKHVLKIDPEAKIIFGIGICNRDEIWFEILRSFEGKVYFDENHRRVLPIIYPNNTFKDRTVTDGTKARFLIMDSAKEDEIDPFLSEEHHALVFLFSAKKRESSSAFDENQRVNWKLIRYGKHCNTDELDAFFKLLCFSSYGCQPKTDTKIPTTTNRFIPNWSYEDFAD